MEDVDLFREFVQTIQGMIETVGPELAPDEDWPGAIAAGDTSKVDLDRTLPMNVTTLPPQAFRDEVTKDVVANVLIPLYVRKANADMAAFFSTAWVSGAQGQSLADDPEVKAKFEAFQAEHGRNPESYEEMEGIGIVRPSDDPERREAVTIIARTKQGRSLLSVGLIERSDGPPKIAEWENNDEDGATAASRFSSALDLAFSDEPIVDDPYLEKVLDGLLKREPPTRPWKES